MSNTAGSSPSAEQWAGFICAGSCSNLNRKPGQCNSAIVPAPLLHALREGFISLTSLS